MFTQTNTHRIEWLFFEILYLHVILYVSVNCWKFQAPNVDLERGWAMAADGQNLCEYRKDGYKRRYYVCVQATKKEIKEGESTKLMFDKTTLLGETEMKDKKYDCKTKPRTVYFGQQYDEDTYLTALKFLFTCPTTDEQGQKYFFGQGKNNNEIGIYKLKKLPKSGIPAYCFIGVMKDLDLDYFGNNFLRIWNKIPILNWFAS